MAVVLVVVVMMVVTAVVFCFIKGRALAPFVVGKTNAEPGLRPINKHLANQLWRRHQDRLGEEEEEEEEEEEQEEE